MRRLVCFLFAVLSLSAAYARQEAALFGGDFPPEEFAQRRSHLYEAIGPNAIALLQGAPSPAGYVRFRQTNEFYYLCGVETPHAYLLLDGSERRAALYLPHRNEARERSEGKWLSAEDGELVRRLSGVEAVYGLELLAEHLARYVLRGVRVLYTPLQPAEGLATSRDIALRAQADRASDPWDGLPSREGRFLALLRERFPQLEIRDLSPLLDELRLIKSPRELELIRKATRLAMEAIAEAMRSTRPGQYEYELEAVARFVFCRHGAQGDAYYALVASGANAWYPHYHAGTRRMRAGELVLMDYAPDVGYYMSDVTRIWPFSGRFSPEQRDERFVADYRASAENPNSALGHGVGMATHDVGLYRGPLRPGMVFTIEPALRVPEDSLYIRLEDVIISPNGGTPPARARHPEAVDRTGGQTSPMELTGKVVLITGGAVRIGRGLVEGQDVLALSYDARRVQEAPALVERLCAHWGRIDVLVLNAARFYRTPWDALSEAQWDELLEINLKGPFFLAQAAARQMRLQEPDPNGIPQQGGGAKKSRTNWP
jgi:Xaa-Pro aminopeptidase